MVRVTAFLGCLSGRLRHAERCDGCRRRGGLVNKTAQWRHPSPRCSRLPITNEQAVIRVVLADAVKAALS